VRSYYDAIAINPPDRRTAEFVDPAEGELFSRYAAIVRRLRAPDGCPWDRKQTLRTLRRFIVEESFEVLAAIEELISTNDAGGADKTSLLEAVAEELGDVILVTLLMTDALEAIGGASLSEILRTNAAKLVRRHPHVFSSVHVKNADEVVANWNEIKNTVEQKPDSVHSVSSGLPPLERSCEIQKKAANLGFDWPDIAPIFRKLQEETDELREAISEAEKTGESLRDNSRVETEIGDLLFTVVNLARKVKCDPSVALAGTNERFLRRFAFVERELERNNSSPATSDLETMDSLWNESKNRERF
jgi:tetrapyrrole methylase family protein / MazG family protein